MNARTTILGALAAVGALSAPLSAQQGKPGETGTTGTGSAGQPAPGQDRGGAGDVSEVLKLQRGDQLLGLDVLDSAGVRLGRLEDLVVLADGTLAYAVAAAGDAPTALVPVPWRAIRFAPPIDETGEPDPESKPRKDLAMVNVDAAQWRSAPHFERWPRPGDRTVLEQSDAFFLASEASAESPVDATSPQDSGSPALFRVSRLRNQTFVDSKGEPLGRVGQLVFDLTAGRLNYLSVSLSDPSGGSGRVVAMPWPALRPSRQGEQEKLATTATGERLRSAPQFAVGEESWKKMSDPRWVGKLYDHYSVRPYWSAAPAAGDAPAPEPKPIPPAKPAGAR